MRIYNMQVNHIENPLGYDLSQPVFSWKIDGVGMQKKYTRVITSADSEYKQIISDSGNKEDIDGIFYQPELTLKPRTRYYWKVKVVSTSEEEAEEESYFETGKMEEKWQGQWICAPFLQSPYICKEFTVESIKEARFYIVGRGVFEIFCNGQKVGEDYLDPGYNSYDLWEQAHTYELKPYIKQGKNVIGIHLGDGWYRGRLGWDGVYENNYGKELMMLGEIHITDLSDRETIYGTDKSWKCSKSPVIESNIYDGEVYDARIEDANWSISNGHHAMWEKVVVRPESMDKVRDRLRLPVRKHEVFVPTIMESPSGEVILDFGQNITGWVEGKISLPADEWLTLQYGEVLQNGCFYRENLRSAKAEYRYCSNGNSGYFRPHFTFYGFRYVKVSGNCTRKELEGFRAYALYSDMKQTGHIVTGHKLLNQLMSNILWGQKDNFLDIPTDCPQRDERMGWTGDTQVFAGTACYNMDTGAFYTKHMKDVMLEQEELNGGIPFVVPYLKTTKENSILKKHSSCVWGDIATVLPWTLYLHYGNISLLHEHYPAMTKWVQYIKKIDDTTGGKRLWKSGFHFADWLSLDNFHNPNTAMGGTDPYYVASAWYAYSALLTAKAAKALGKIEDEMYYGKLYEEVREAMQKEYFTPNGMCAIPTQTAKVLALHMNLIQDSHRKRIAEDLVEQLKCNGMKLETGFCGTPFLCKVLSDMGYVKEAYDILLREELPGWLYAVRMGATTVWERWDSILPDYSMNPKGMNSLNHYAYGAVQEWIYQDVCGIKMKEESPAFQVADICPKPDSRIEYAECIVETTAGRYECKWQIKNEEIIYHIVVPFDRKAYVTLPNEETMVLSSGTYEYSRKFTK